MSSPAQQPLTAPITVVQLDLEQLADLLAAKLAMEQLQPLRTEIATEMAKMKTEVAVIKTRLNYISLGWLGAVAVFVFAVIKLARI
jgi:phosphoribosylcarboxyaminoimidazole (NCAIR) mutase